MRFGTFTLFLFGLSFCIASADVDFSSSAQPCTSLLTTTKQIQTVFDQEFQTVLRESSQFRRIYLAIRENALRDRTLQQCANLPGGCTATDIARFVKNAIEGPKNPELAGYAYLIGGMAGFAAVTSGVTLSVSSSAEFIPVFVTSFFAQLSFIAVNLLSAFHEPLSAKIRRFAFQLKAKKQGPATSSSLDKIADLTHGVYTWRALASSERILLFRNTLWHDFTAAAKAMETGELDQVIAMLGGAAMAGYRHFRDLSPEDPTIVQAIRATFLIKVKDPKLLITPTLEYIQENDPSFFRDAEKEGELSPQKYYVQALTAWLNGN